MTGQGLILDLEHLLPSAEKLDKIREAFDVCGSDLLSNYLKMARRHCRRNHRSAHASCNTPR